jgi:hypothetical protein
LRNGQAIPIENSTSEIVQHQTKKNSKNGFIGAVNRDCTALLPNLYYQHQNRRRARIAPDFARSIALNLNHQICFFIKERRKHETHLPRLHLRLHTRPPSTLLSAACTELALSTSGRTIWMQTRQDSTLLWATGVKLALSTSARYLIWMMPRLEGFWRSLHKSPQFHLEINSRSKNFCGS